jgi:hypothetical protein
MIFQDDFLAKTTSLEDAMKYFVYSDAKWMATGCNHRVDATGKVIWDHFPRFIPSELFDAQNSLGCPSVIYTKANSIQFDLIFFTESLNEETFELAKGKNNNILYVILLYY